MKIITYYIDRCNSFLTASVKKICRILEKLSFKILSSFLKTFLIFQKLSAKISKNRHILADIQKISNNSQNTSIILLNLLNFLLFLL